MILQIQIVSLMILPAFIWASPNVDFITQQSSTSNKTKTGFLSKFNLDASFEHSQRVAQDENSKREESLDLGLGVGYVINPQFRASVRTFFSKPNTESQETEISNTQIGLAITGVELNSYMRSVHSVAGVLPTSVRSRDQDRLLGGLSLTNGLRFQRSRYLVQYLLGYNENFHEFNINAFGSPNIQRTLVQTLTSQVQLPKNFSISLIGIYSLGRTYGNKERSSFQVHGDINYDLTDKMALNLGMSNAGQALKANGVDSNITAYDADTAVVRAGVSIVL